MKNYLGLIEMLFIFGCGVALVVWELYSLRRSSRRDQGKTSQRDAPSKEP